MEELHTIIDRQGTEYALEFRTCDQLWTLKVREQGVRVASANCIITSPSLMLGDIQVEDEVALPPRGLIAWCLKRKTLKKCRTLGLGTALIEFIITKARKAQFTEIYGNLSQRDLDANPSLPAWYEKRGFQIEPGGDFRRGRVRILLE